MIATISTTSIAVDPLCFDLMAESKIYDTPVRMNRYATLDGSAVLANYGFSDSDRTIKLVANLTPIQYASLLYLIKNETFFAMSCDAGFFVGGIESVVQEKGGVVITFLPCDDLHTIPVEVSTGGGTEPGEELIKDFVSGHYYRETSHSTFSFPSVEAKWGYSTTNGRYRTSISFGATTLPSVVDTAVLRVTAGYVSYKSDPVYMDISADVSASPALPSSWTDFDQVPDKTSNRAFWKISAEDWTDGTEYDSPDISNVLKELAAHANYDPSNLLVLHTDSQSRETQTSVFNTNVDGMLKLVINEA